MGLEVEEERRRPEGRCLGRSQGEGTNRGGRARPSGLETNLIIHRVIDPT